MQVSILAISDTKQVNLCLYNLLIVSVVGVTFTMLLENQDVMLYGVVSCCLIIGTTLTQLVLFVPKVSKLHYHECFYTIQVIFFSLTLCFFLNNTRL